MKTESIEKILGTIIKVGLIVTAVVKVAQFALKTLQTFTPTVDIQHEEIEKQDE